MTAEIIGQLVQRLQKGESSPLLELVSVTAQDVRLFVASYVPTTALVDQITKEIYAVVKSEIARCPANTQALAWIIRTAATLLGARLNDATYQAMMARDPLIQVVSQAGLIALAQNIKGENDVAVKLPRQLQFQPPSLQLLIKRHYGEGMSVANLALAQGLAEEDIAQSLVSARARLDWSGAAGVIDTADHTFPKLIEDYMAGAIAPEARALLVSSIIQDELRSVQFDRQMRLHLWLCIYFTPLDQDAIRTLVQSLPARDDSSRLVKTAARPATVRLNRSEKSGSGPRPSGGSVQIKRNTTDSRQPTQSVRRSETLPSADATSAPNADEHNPAPTIIEQLRQRPVIVIAALLIFVLVIGVMIGVALSGGGETADPKATVTAQEGANTEHPQGDINYGIIHRVEGVAEITRNGVILPVNSGEAIASGDAFITKGTAVVGTLIGDQVRLTLGNDTTVPGVTKNEQTITGQLQLGRLGADIRRGPNVSALIVQTPQGHIEQLDAGSLVEVVAGVTRVQVSRGMAKVSRADGTATIEAKAGSVVLIRDGVDPVLEGSGVFVRGVNFGEGTVTIEGNTWLSQREAEGAGLSLAEGTKLGESALISGPGLDFDSRRMYDRGLTSEDGKIGIKQTLPNGEYNLNIWVAGTAGASWKDLQLAINDEPVALGIQADKTDPYRRLGPFRFSVKEKVLALSLSGLSKTHLAGMALSAAGELQGSLPPMVVITTPEPNFSGPAFDLDVYARTDNPDTVAKIAYYNGEILLGEVNKAPFALKWKNPPPGEFNLTAVATDTSGTSNRSGNVKGNLKEFASATGVLMETWNNVGNGKTVEHLRLHKHFNDPPDAIEFISTFKGAPKGINLGVRYRAFLTPPLDGKYSFQLIGKDGCELWLSPDEDPAKRVRICWQKDYAEEGESKKYPGQKSKPISLKAGTSYYIEALLKHANGDAHLEVGWKKPDGTEDAQLPRNLLRPSPQGSAIPKPKPAPTQAVVIANPPNPLPNPSPNPSPKPSPKPSPIPPVIGEIIPEAPAGPLLSGKGEQATGIVNLSMEGTTDWIHYGSKDASSQNRKANGSGELSVAVAINGADIKRNTDNVVVMGWTDGTPEAIKAVSLCGITSTTRGKGTMGKGITFTAPADPILRQLKIWVGAFSSKAIFTASVSDNSSPPFTETFDAGRGRKFQVYTILYRSQKAGQILTVNYTHPDGANAGSIMLQGVALTECSNVNQRFITGLNIEGDSVEINGDNWLGAKEAAAAGVQIKNERRVTVGAEPKPTVDAAMKKMLGTGLAARNGELEITQKIPNGNYEVTVYMLETVTNNAHLFDVRINNVFLTDIGKLEKNEWKAYGPIVASVDAGTLTIATVTKKGTPQLMGYSVHTPARIKGIPTNAFPNGEAHAIPGVIHGANFDRGGEDKAFHEQSDQKGNEGGAYRPGSVDIVDSGGIPVIGYINRGEWLRYTTSVAEAGTYAVTVSYAKGLPTDAVLETVSIEIDGKLVGIPGPIVGATDWNTFRDVDLGTVTLSAGVHDLRCLFNGNYNVKTLTFTKTN